MPIASARAAIASLASRHRHAVEEVGIDHHRVGAFGIEEGGVADLGRSRIAAGGSDHRYDRQAIFRAKSRSRWSCAGQPKIAPSP